MKKYCNYSRGEKKCAYEKLNEYSDPQVLNESEDGFSWGAINGQINNITIKKASLKRSTLVEVKVANSSYIDCAMTGSHFKRIIFMDSFFIGNNLLSTTFNDCEFINTSPKNSLSNNSFSRSQFYNCKFENVVFVSSTVSQTLFCNCLFNNCTFSAVTLEDTIFLHCKMKDVDMTSTNVEYAIFNNSYLCNVGFPFYQFFYICGSSDIISEKQNIYLKADNKIMRAEEFSDFFDALLVYYSDKQTFYPSVNILITLKETKLAQDCLRDGIEMGLCKEDFRIVKYICELGKKYALIDASISKSILGKIDAYLIKINSEDMRQKLPSNIVQQMLLYSGEIRQVLFTTGSRDKQTLQFSVYTDISEKQVKKINKLQNRIQKILDLYGAEVKYMEIRHNSPYEFLITVISNPEIILMVSSLIFRAIVSFGKYLYNRRLLYKDPMAYIENQLRKKYGDILDITTEDRIQLLKEKINDDIKELQLKVAENKSGKINRYIRNIGQKIIGEFDDTFPEKNYIIFSAKQS